MIPNIDTVVTGGTHQLGDWDTVNKILTSPCPEPVSKEILVNIIEFRSCLKAYLL